MILFRLFWRFVLLCTDLTNEFLTKNGPQLAAAVAYYALLSFIPLSLALISLLGFLLGSIEAQDRLAVALGNMLPVSQDSVGKTIESISHTRTITGIIGLLGLLWPSTVVFGTIRKSVNHLWGVTKTRPFFQERFIDFALTAATGFLMITPLALTVGIGFLGEITRAIWPGSSIQGDQLVGRVIGYLSPAVSFAVFMLLYRYLPNTTVTFREVWPGALLASLAFEVAKWVFLWYARTYPLFMNVYGPVGALVALLGWVWVSAYILLYGAMVTSHYSRYMARRAEETGLQILAGVRRLVSAESNQSRIEG